MTPEPHLAAVGMDSSDEFYKSLAFRYRNRSFTVPGADARNLPGIKYDKQADEDSWSRMTKLFVEQFGK